VTFDAALNVLWCAIGIVALLPLFIFELRKWSCNETGRVCRVVAVLLTTVSLFPRISAEVVSVEGGDHGMGSWDRDPAMAHWKSDMIEWLRKMLQ
jgi:hypothetical protein